MADPITVWCPSCDTSFPVDPEKVPSGGVNARCSECSEVFRVDDPAEHGADGDEAVESSPSAGANGVPDHSGTDTDPFGGAGSFGGDVGLVERDDDLAEREDDLAGPEDDVFGAPSEPAVDEDPAVDAGGLPSSSIPAVDEADDGAASSAEAPAIDETPAVDDSPARPKFGQRSPEEKAQRLARVLVSDMITYNPQLYETALAQGSIVEDFEEEIEKSWEEYVEQVGEDLATSTPYWTEALNEILARGEDVF